LQFIKHHMPTFAKRLSYRILDMSTFRTLATALCNYKSELNPAHRAKEDVLYSYSLMLDFIKKLRHSEPNRSLN
jgi:oligoribonuclease (3'-5' exoribonuclease)